MRTEPSGLADERMAVDEMRLLVSAQFPGTTYELAAGDDPDGLYLTAAVDVDDPDAVVDVFVDRLFSLQVDEGLPVYVIPIRTPERQAALVGPSMQLRGDTVTARRPARASGTRLVSRR
jgi:hypothetical protein